MKDFNHLVASVLSGEASPEDVAQLKALLAQDPLLKQRLAELAQARKVLEKLAPFTPPPPAPPPPFPEHRMGELRDAVRKAFKTAAQERPGVSWVAELRRILSAPAQGTSGLSAGDSVATFVENLVQRLDELKPTGTLIKDLRTALSQPVNSLLLTNQLAVQRSSTGIAIYCPLGATHNLTPTILWKMSPGEHYDLVITDELNSGFVPLRLTAVRCPIVFSEIESWKQRKLAGNGLYRLMVRVTGNPLSTAESTFRTLDAITLPPVQAPAEHIERALDYLTSTKPTVSDALAELMALPPELATTELVLRLKLMAFGQLGLAEEYNETKARLQQSA